MTMAIHSFTSMFNVVYLMSDVEDTYRSTAADRTRQNGLSWRVVYLIIEWDGGGSRSWM